MCFVYALVSVSVLCVLYVPPCLDRLVYLPTLCGCFDNEDWILACHAMAQHSMTSSGLNEPFSTPKSAVGPKPAKALCTSCFSHSPLSDESTKPRVQLSEEREASVERGAMP